MKHKPKAILLLSGGLDSGTAGMMAKAQGFELYALSFKYGQRHLGEIKAARRVARFLGVREQTVAGIDLRAFGGSALTSDAIEVPKNRPAEELDQGIPVTYVPARNTIFLAFALGWAEVLGVTDIFIGVNALDFSGYPDCRPQFVKAFEKLANTATRIGTELGGKFTIHAPLISLTKARIIKEGTRLGFDYSLTRTCYDPDRAGRSCGACDACQLRLKGFAEAGLVDPIPYQKSARSARSRPVTARQPRQPKKTAARTKPALPPSAVKKADRGRKGVRAGS